MSNTNTFTGLVARTVELAQAALTTAGSDKTLLAVAQRAIRQARTVRVRTNFVDTTGNVLPASAGVDIIAIQEALDGGLLAPVTPKAPAATKVKAPKVAAPKVAAPVAA